MSLSSSLSISVTPSAPLTLATLPQELLTSILVHLDPFSYVYLSRTSRFFYTHCPTSHFPSTRQGWIDKLFGLEQRAVKESSAAAKVIFLDPSRPTAEELQRVWYYLPYESRTEKLYCYKCFTDLPWESFARSQRMRARGYGCKDGWKRFCVTCGIKQGIYVKGKKLRGGGSTTPIHGTAHGPTRMLVCGVCEELKNLDEAKEGVCRQCYAEHYSTRKDEMQRKREEAAKKRALLEATSSDKGRRKGRCQRCWSIDHTTRNVAGLSKNANPLCESCLEVANKLESRPVIPHEDQLPWQALSRPFNNLLTGCQGMFKALFDGGTERA